MIGKAAPEFEGIKGWINSDPLELRNLKGRVVFLDFWTYCCINCTRTLPHVRELHDQHALEGLVVIGVHTPEFPFERDPKRVANAVQLAGLRYPIALDNDNVTWKLYGNQYWPRQTIVDMEGVVRYEHVGEGDYGEMERKVVELLSGLLNSPKQSEARSK